MQSGRIFSGRSWLKKGCFANDDNDDEEEKEAYEITFVSVCISVCVCPTACYPPPPPILLGALWEHLALYVSFRILFRFFFMLSVSYQSKAGD
jgi:hypothetical protein